MNVHVDKSGRLVLPKAVRQQLGITPDTDLEIVPAQGGILLRPVADQPPLRQIDGLWVHQGTATSSADWGRLVSAVREERAASAWAP